MNIEQNTVQMMKKPKINISKKQKKEAILAVQKFLELVIEKGDTISEEEIYKFITDIGFNYHLDAVSSYLKDEDLWELAKNH